MQNAIDLCVSKCIQRGYVDEAHAPWLHYAIEKRGLSLLIGFPFWLFGIWISSAKCATMFFLGFSILRTRTSGYHADSAWKCFCLSLFAELFFLGALPVLLSIKKIYALTLLASAFIFKYAPYHCEKMQLSNEEMQACSIGAKIRIVILNVGVFLFYQLGQNDLALGLALGIVMTATLLSFAYILQKRE